jgi:hypothetical protein
MTGHRREVPLPTFLIPTAGVPMGKPTPKEKEKVKWNSVIQKCMPEGSIKRDKLQSKVRAP